MPIFLICGYGIPEDLSKDENYLAYLRVACNRMYAMAANEEVVVMPSGGATNCTPPFEGTEAKMIGNFVRAWMARPEVLDATKGWRVIEEDRSLSTLENLVFVKEILDAEHLQGDVAVFCEATREGRLKAIAPKVFGKATIESIDFDTSKNRYADPAMIAKKEFVETETALWVLEDPAARLPRHHIFFEKKFAFLRQKQSEGLSHVDAVAEWYKIMAQEFATAMPDAPATKRLE